MPTFTRAGATIAYEDSGAPAGRPDAPTIVFGHGLLFSGWMFREQVAGLSPAYRCVTVDWRGQGASPAAAGGCDMDTLAEDGSALIRHLGAGPVHWVGLSMGGFLGMRIAARHPEQVRSLVLLNTSAEREARRATVEDLALSLIYRAAGIAPVRRQVEQIMFAPGFADSHRELMDEWFERLSGSDRAAVAAAVRAVVLRKPVAAELPDIQAPTLVIAGSDDKPTPPHRGLAIAQAIPRARFELLDGVGHSSSLESPETVTALIEEFVAAHSRSNPGELADHRATR